MAGVGEAPDGTAGSFQDVNLTEDDKERINKSTKKKLTSGSSEENVDIPLSCFDKFKKLVFSKEEWEAYLIEKMEKYQQRRLKGNDDK